MTNHNTIDEKKQEPKYISKKYKSWIESELKKINEIIDSASKSKEALGYGDVSFIEFLKVEIDLEKDQSEVNALLAAKEEARRALEAQECLFDEEQLLWSVSKEPNTTSLQRVANRIKLLREIGDSVSADILEKKLIDEAKRHGIKPKAIKDLISSKKNKEPASSELPFHVLGYTPERKILIWHKGNLISIPVSQLRADELSLIVGPNIEIEFLKSQIIKVAHENGLIDEANPIKSGIWHINNEWLLVSGLESLSIKSNSVTLLEGPVFQDKIVHFEKNGWIAANKINLCKCSLKETFEALLKHISQWEWEHPDMAAYVTAFVMLAPFQQAMSWRPWLYVTGPTSSGKSAFFEYVLEQIYGRLIKKIDKATAHSAAQAVGNSSKILILDEFEKSNKHIPEILEVLKLMSRGGAKTSGTTGKNEVSYALHHMPWMASIYLPKTISIDESQRNRMIRFDLRKKKGGKSLNTLSSQEAETLCANIISSMISHWEEIQRIAVELEKDASSMVESLDGKISGRTVQNFMYALALLSVATGKKYAVPDCAKQEEIDDGQTIIKSIFNTKTRYDGVEYLVCDLIEIAVGEPIPGISLNSRQALNALRLNGLSVVKSGTWFVAFHPESIRKHLLKNDEDLRDLDISAPIERIAGAKKHVKTAWGEGSRKEWCIHIPINCLFNSGEAE
jgi:hypothetical protein